MTAVAVVTISASYAAGGSEIGPRIAARLGAEFVDRAVPVAVADQLGISVDEADAVARNTTSRFWEVFARMSPLSGTPTAADRFVGDRDLVRRTADHLRELAARGDCVVLGHAGAVVLAGVPGALHVRLDGSADGRIAAAMRQHTIDRETAADQLARNDRIRAGYVRHFYDADPKDPAMYDLVLDTVRLGWACAEDLVVATATDARRPV